MAPSVNKLWGSLSHRVRQTRYRRSARLKRISLEQVLEDCSDLHLDLSCWNKDLRAGSLSDTFIFAALVYARAPRSYFEIGTGFGRSATLAALNTPSDAEIRTIGIDYIDNPRIGWIFREHPLAGKIHAMQGDSKSFCFDPWLGKVDFVFVDGAHDFEAVANDTAVAFGLIAPGGWIIWHDLSMEFPGVAKALYSCDRADEIFEIASTHYAWFRDGRPNAQKRSTQVRHSLLG